MMSVLSVEEIPINRGGLDAGSLDDRDEQRQWLITTSSPATTRFDIVNSATYTASTVPSYLAPHPENTFYTCRSVRVEHQEGVFWYATASYSTQPVSREERERNETPIPQNRLTSFSVDSVEFQRYSDKDAKGVAYKNSAGVPYPAQIHEDSRLIVRVRKNISSFSTDWFLLRNTVNTNQVTIYDGISSVTIQPDNGLLKRLVMGELAEENGYSYYPLSAEVHVNPNGWKRELIDQGFTALDTDGKLFRMKVYEADGAGGATSVLVDSSEELPLNGSGLPLFAPDGTPTDPLVTELQFNEFDEFEEEDWSSLPFWT